MDLVERHKEANWNDESAEPVDAASDKVDSDSSLTGTEQTSSISSVLETPSNPLAKSVKDVEASINRLHRLAMFIRKSSTQNRNLTATDFAILDEDGQDTSSQFKSFALQIVQARLPAANPEIHRRLADLILARRKAFSYQQRHQQKLARVVKPTIRVPNARQPMGNYNGLQFAQSSHRGVATDPTALVRNFAIEKALSATTATVLNLNSVLSRVAPSVVSSSAASSTPDTNQLDFPQAPKVMPSAKEFQCPYCGLMMDIKERKPRRWK